MLDAGIVDQDVHAAQLAPGIFHQGDALLGLGQVGAVVEHADTELGGQIGAQFLDAIAEAVQHDAAALGGQGAGDAQADAAGRSGDDGVASFQHSHLPILS